MKKILLAGVILLLPGMLSAQVLISLIFGDKLNGEKLEFGLDVGANWSTLTNLSPSSYKSGFNLGMTFLYKFSDNLQLNPCLYYMFPGGAQNIDPYPIDDPLIDPLLLMEETRINRLLNGFSLPVTLRYRLFGHTFVEAGPQLSLITTAKDRFVGSVKEEDDFVYVLNVRDRYRKFDAGITGGFAQRFKDEKGITVKVRYYYGFRDLSLDPAAAGQHSSVFYLSVSIPVGAAD